MDYDFPYIGNVIIPTDELIFVRGVGIPPTRYILKLKMSWSCKQAVVMQTVTEKAPLFTDL